ncbi:RNA polymerase sigma factor [Actinoplanes sp. CA-131856]
MELVTHGDASPEPDPSEEFDHFFRETYAALVTRAMAVGGTWTEATDAAAETMEQVLRNWATIKNPRAYARKAVLSNLIKAKQRDRERIRRECQTSLDRSNPAWHAEQNLWEDGEVVKQLLETLPPAQREVLTLICQGFTPTQIAALLGDSAEAVRQNLQRARRRLKTDLKNQDVRRRQELRGKTPRRTTAKGRGGELK